MRICLKSLPPDSEEHMQAGGTARFRRAAMLTQQLLAYSKQQVMARSTSI